jgi:hypothetical protein
MSDVAIRISSLRGPVNNRQVIVYPGSGVLILRGEIYTSAKFQGGIYQPASPDDLQNFPWRQCRKFREGIYPTADGGRRDYVTYRAGAGLSPGNSRVMTFFLNPNAARSIRMWICMCKLKILKLRAKRLALMMASHPRLGAESCLGQNSIPREVLEMIVRRKLM